MRYRFHTAEVSIVAADTEVSWTVPEGACNIEVKSDDPTVKWRWSDRAGQVATPGNGHPIDVGEALVDIGCVHQKQDLYFAAEDACVLKIAFNSPINR